MKKGKKQSIITFKDLIYAGLSGHMRDRKTTPENPESVWYYIADEPSYYTPAGQGVIDRHNKLILYPATKPGFMVFKEFHAPFFNCKWQRVETSDGVYLKKNEDYFSKQDSNGNWEISFDDVLREVKKQIDAGMYQSMSRPSLKKLLESSLVKVILKESDNENNLKILLRYCITMYSSEFLNSDLPEAVLLKKHFGDMIDSLNRGEKAQRALATDFLDDIFKAKTTKTYGDKALPKHLYLGGMYEYLLKIAERDYPKKSRDSDLSSVTTITKKKMAKFFSYSQQSFKKELEEEKKFIAMPEKAPKPLVYKVASL